MSRKTSGLIPFLLLFLLGNATGQTHDFQRRILPFIVSDENGSAYDMPMLGGMNTPLHELVDIDGDNDVDLFIKDRANELLFLRNTGTPGAYDFSWETNQYQQLKVGAWFKFIDIDGDNDADLYAENPFGILSLYRNEGSPANAVFVLVIDSLRDDQGAIILVDGFSVPEWADIDCDGDLDMFLGRQTGYITYYENIGTGSDGLPVFQYQTDIWQNLQILTGGALKNNNQERHGANSLTWIDIDDDNDLDLFWGDLFAPGVIYLENTGTCTEAQVDTNNMIDNYPPSNPIQTGGYNVPRFTDIDADGDADMLVGVQGGAISFIRDQRANFYFYRNNGTIAAPDFVEESRSFISSVDIGRSSAPALVDLDNDGDLDLFLANKEDVDSPDLLNCRIFYFENLGNAQQPEFRLRSSNFLEYDKRLDLNYAMAFADLNNDATYDLLLGKWQGDLTYYRNDGSPAIANFTRVDENFGGIDIGNDHAPALADLDGDGDLDMISGEFSGNLDFLRNTGDVANPVFTLEDPLYLGIDAGSFSTPHLTDLDGDGDVDLLLGSEDQGLRLFVNNGTPQNPLFELDASFQLAELPPDVHPASGDLDGDGDMDILCGTDGGGIIYYENRRITTGITPTAENAVSSSIQLLSNYPNPFNPATTIRFRLAEAGLAELAIYDLLGNRIRVLAEQALLPGDHEFEWDGRNSGGLPAGSGMYFYRLSLKSSSGNGGQQSFLTRSMLLLR